MWMVGCIDDVRHEGGKLVFTIAKLSFGIQQGAPFNFGTDARDPALPEESRIAVLLPDEEGALWMESWQSPAMFACSGSNELKELQGVLEKGAAPAKLPLPTHFAEVLPDDVAGKVRICMQYLSPNVTPHVLAYVLMT